MEHFTQRTKALIIDAIVVTLFTALVNNILYILLSRINNQMLLSNYDIVVLALVTIFYFTILEAKTNKTIGKKMTHLYVSDEEGYMSYPKAFIRNITKIFWIPLIFDIIIGKIFNFPSRLFDKLAGTDVYADEELEHVNSIQEDKPEEIVENVEKVTPSSEYGDIVAEKAILDETSTDVEEDTIPKEDVEEVKKDPEEIIVDHDIDETVEDEITGEIVEDEIAKEAIETPIVEEIKPEIGKIDEENSEVEVAADTTANYDDEYMTDEEIVKDIFGDEIEESEVLSSTTSEDVIEESEDLTLQNLSEEVTNEEDDFVELEPEKDDGIVFDDDFDFIDLTDIEDDEDDDDFEELEPASHTNQTKQKEE